MSFQPDIIVAGPDGVALVVETKVDVLSLGETSRQLWHYMFSTHCPTGILASPQRMWIYRDALSSPPNVELVGEFDMTGEWQRPPLDPFSFELFVQQWLERVAQQSASGLPHDFARALREYVVPSIQTGELRAAHPRYA